MTAIPASITPAEMSALITRAAEIRETSWRNDKRAYHLTIFEATVLATEEPHQKVWADLVNLLLFTSWNDSLLWAEANR